MNESNIESDFELDNISFKAVTKGLGFHHDKKPPVTKEAIKNHVIQKRELNTDSNNFFIDSSTLDTGVTPAELDIFYNNKVENTFHSGNLGAVDQIPLPTESVVSDKYINAALWKRFISWPIDCLVILTVTAVTILSFFYIAGIDFDLAKKVVNEDSILLIGALFILYYTLYFSVMDLKSSIGKSVFNMSVLTNEETHPTFQKTFFRSILSLIGIALALFPFIFRVHDKITKTKVVIKER